MRAYDRVHVELGEVRRELNQMHINESTRQEQIQFCELLNDYNVVMINDILSPLSNDDLKKQVIDGGSTGKFVLYHVAINIISLLKHSATDVTYGINYYGDKYSFTVNQNKREQWVSVLGSMFTDRRNPPLKLTCMKYANLCDLLKTERHLTSHDVGLPKLNYTTARAAIPSLNVNNETHTLAVKLLDVINDNTTLLR